MPVTDTLTVNGKCRWSLRTDLEPEIDLIPNSSRKESISLVCNFVIGSAKRWWSAIDIAIAFAHCVILVL